MEETYSKPDNTSLKRGTGRSEIEKHVEVNNSNDMLGGLEDRRPATARSKGKLPRLLCGWTGGVDHPGARGGGGRGGGGGGVRRVGGGYAGGGARRNKRRRSPTHSLEVNALHKIAKLWPAHLDQRRSRKWCELKF